jgi:hypothetical protein
MTARRWLVWLSVGVVLSSCGGGSSHRSTSATTVGSGSNRGQVNQAGVTMKVPPGWASETLTQPDGVEIAQNTADLSDSAPAGPRLVGRIGSQQESQASDLMSQIDHSGPISNLSTSATTVGGRPAVSVEWSEALGDTNETTRTVIVSLAHNLAYVFTLEAPTSLWSASLSTLQGALAAVSINADAVGNRP